LGVGLILFVLSCAYASVAVPGAAPAVSPRGGHAPTAERRVATSARSGASRSALTRYDDPSRDALIAPDICGGSLMTNDDRSITAALHICNRSAFGTFDSYSLFLDTDSNPATGDVAEGGADYLVDVSGRTSALTIWDTSSFEIVVPQPKLPTAWVEGLGPAVRMPRGALGDPRALHVTFRTTHESDFDVAPNSGSWPYQLLPLGLSAGELHVGRAIAGRDLVAAMNVTRSDFGMPLNDGRVACDASVAGKRLAGRRLATPDRITCAWRLPVDASVKRCRGTVAVTYQRASTKRSFSVLIDTPLRPAAQP
jgi:hypothetical protein